jgi:PadR family transcriptional regulator PadR
MSKQEKILTAIYSQSNRAYGNQISKYLKEKYNVNLSVYDLYNELDRMLKVGLVNAEKGEKTPERGNRPRKYYSVTDAGKRVMNGVSSQTDSFGFSILA